MKRRDFLFLALTAAALAQTPAPGTVEFITGDNDTTLTGTVKKAVADLELKAGSKTWKASLDDTDLNRLLMAIEKAKREKAGDFRSVWAQKNVELLVGTHNDGPAVALQIRRSATDATPGRLVVVEKRYRALDAFINRLRKGLP